METVIPTILLLALAYGIWMYNRLVSYRHRVAAAWSDVDVQLKRRHDLLPKLAATVRAYSNFEREVNEHVTALRAQLGSGAVDGGSAGEVGPGESLLSSMFRRIFAVAEAYPDLKASGGFLELQRSVADVEQHIQYARRFYNGAVRQLNVAVEQFPSNIIANAFSFVAAPLFEIELAIERESPDMELEG
jgi:LemA protein